MRTSVGKRAGGLFSALEMFYHINVLTVKPRLNSGPSVINNKLAIMQAGKVPHTAFPGFGY